MSNNGIALAQQVAELAESAKKIREKVEKKAEIIKVKEERLKHALLSPDRLRSMEANLKVNLPSWLSPGNVGDLNKVIWPFIFQTDDVGVLSPNTNRRTQFSNTLEGAFVVTHYTKAVFLVDSVTNEETYIDPTDSSAAGLATNLQFSIRDAVSTREFFNRAANLDLYGNPINPTRMVAPQLVIPKGSYEINFFNNDSTNYYRPFIAFFGYKIRIEEAEKILSTISG